MIDCFDKALAFSIYDYLAKGRTEKVGNLSLKLLSAFNAVYFSLTREMENITFKVI